VPITDVQTLQATIDADTVVVFSKTTCGYCRKTKALFAELNQDVAVYELNEMGNGGSIQDLLAEMTTQRSVPNVFVKGQHIGGNSDTFGLFKSGELQKLLE
jgi:glutaredoxin 3